MSLNIGAYSIVCTSQLLYKWWFKWWLDSEAINTLKDGHFNMALKIPASAFNLFDVEVSMDPSIHQSYYLRAFGCQ